MKKDLKQIVQMYEQWGWSVEKTNGGHLRFKGPKGELVFSGSTPSDWRAIANLKAQLRRATAMVQQRG
jgi:predicted RNA binding protein YcfA (HicA-like mRNA interferase family)